MLIIAYLTALIQILCWFSTNILSLAGNVIKLTEHIENLTAENRKDIRRVSQRDLATIGSAVLCASSANFAVIYLKI